MGTVTFDTHDFIKAFESSGCTEEQAEALARARKKVHETGLDDLATKKDLLEVKLEIIKWLIGGMSLLFALLKFFPPT